MSLKATLLDSYRKAGTGRKIWRFSVSGSAKELEQYRVVQGNNFRTVDGTDTGAPLFFLPAVDAAGNVRAIDRQLTLTITGGDNPRVVVDSTADEIAVIQKAKALVPQELAKSMANSMFNHSAQGGVTVQTVAQTPAETVVPDDKEKTISQLEGQHQGTDQLDD